MPSAALAFFNHKHHEKCSGGTTIQRSQNIFFLISSIYLQQNTATAQMYSKKEHFYGGAKIVFLFVIVQHLVIEKT